MTGNEIRAAFLEFFKERGHDVIPSASLIPHGDPTLLLTSAGMVPFKPYYLGEQVPPNRRLASCQKCFRTTDIESVGDRHHLTFFEMLGNFSIGDYFKKEAISWGWEFVTRRMGIPIDRLWITIYLDDDESFGYWREQGVAEERIIRLGDKDNFWGPAGNSGPCGPCSEIHYDLGPDTGCRRLGCAPGCDCDRFSEIWNLVFTQYNQDESGNRTPLPKPNIDTGMGLERMAAVLQHNKSVYETDLFAPLIDIISGLAGVSYGDDCDTDNAMRIVVEHARGLTFLIGDGVMPESAGRGYVLRRLLRRAVLFSRRLGEDKPFLTETARRVIRDMGDIYPEIRQRQDFIIRLIEVEEQRFGETLNTGLRLLEDVTEEVKHRGGDQIPGEVAFRLYDTYGFPVELTGEVVAASNLAVDMEGFEQAMACQRARAKAAHRFVNKCGDGAATIESEVEFRGYETLDCSSAISILLAGDDQRQSETITEGEEAGIVLQATPFYAEMGGQVGDTGEIIGPGGRFAVTNTVKLPTGVTVHQGQVSQGSLSVGETVTAAVDIERRQDIARNHTATHLLQLALRRVLGAHVEQRGSLVTPERLRFDFSHLEALTPVEITEVNRLVNAIIRRNLCVSSAQMPYQQAISEGAIALFDEKYGDTVRVVSIGSTEIISAELCGGTHVAATGEIGFFQIVSEGSIGAGLRRVEAVTGRGAAEYIGSQLGILHNVAKALGASTTDVGPKFAGLLDDLEVEKRRANTLESELAKRVSADLESGVESVGEVKVVAAVVPTLRTVVVREISDRLKERLGSAVIVLGMVQSGKPFFIAAVTDDLVKRGYHAGKLISQVAAVTGGKGGGKPGFAQAGGVRCDTLDDALRRVKELVQAPS